MGTVSWYSDVELKTPEEMKQTPIWKVPDGTTVFEITGEPRSVQVPDLKDKSKLVTKFVFPVKVAGVDFAWFVNQAKMTDSLYGQLVALAKANNGLTGAKLKLTALGQGLRRVYKVELA